MKLFEDDDDGHDDHNHHHDESHDSHGEDHANHESTHKDLILQYEYRCATTSSLSNVRLNLFEYFDDLSDIDVTYLGSSTQKQVTMTGKNSQMDLSQ